MKKKMKLRRVNVAKISKTGFWWSWKHAKCVWNTEFRANIGWFDDWGADSSGWFFEGWIMETKDTHKRNLPLSALSSHYFTIICAIFVLSRFWLAKSTIFCFSFITRCQFIEPMSTPNKLFVYTQKYVKNKVVISLSVFCGWKRN